MKYIFISCCLTFLISTACKKNEKIEFTLKSLTLKSYKNESFPKQQVYLKVIHQETGTIAETDTYPGEYTLPVKFGLEHPVQMNFYKNDYSVELWGDSSGLIGTNPIHLKDYKIIYPLDMETENDGIEIVLSGTWK